MRPHCQRGKGSGHQEEGEEKVADHIFPPPPERKKREKGPLSPLGYSSFTQWDGVNWKPPVVWPSSRVSVSGSAEWLLILALWSKGWSELFAAWLHQPGTWTRCRVEQGVVGWLLYFLIKTLFVWNLLSYSIEKCLTTCLFVFILK